jgi:O-antigen biosynthesis alpha-1,3-rhamnosyltransferase
VVIPTYNAGPQLLACLRPLLASPLKAQILVVDSSSRDGTAQLAINMGVEVISIPQHEFNHGATREMARHRVGGEIVVMLTQDAILTSPDSLRQIVAAFDDPAVVAAYGRQLPRADAKPIGAHARLFNYPQLTRIKARSDAGELGIKTAFLSNSFAAYRQSALDAVGGFPGNVIMGEDIFAAARLLLAGGKVAYVAEATVFHSHDYSVLEEFRRYFDIGVFFQREHWIVEAFGRGESEGKRFVLSEFRYLLTHASHLIPSAMLRTVTKYLGYRLGAAEALLPRWLKSFITMHQGYWARL